MEGDVPTAHILAIAPVPLIFRKDKIKQQLLFMKGKVDVNRLQNNNKMQVIINT